MKLRVLFSCLLLGPVFAQDARLTLKELVERAGERYPLIQVTAKDIESASASIAVARNAFLPQVDAIASVNRATANNVFGLQFPNQVIPPISGPPVDGGQWRSAFGSSLGVLVSWEPFDFGRRQAGVDVSAAAKARAEAAMARTKLDVRVAAGDAYLTSLAAQQAVQAARAGLKRNQEFLTVLEALTRAQLRPGADLARMQAEIIQIETQLVRAEQGVAQANALVEQYLGAPGARLDAGPFLAADPAGAVAESVPPSHPQLVEQERAIDEIIARLKSIDKGWYPRFAIQAAAFGRGSGARVTGPYAGGGYGLYPDRGNWAVGFTAVVPLLANKNLKAQEAVEARQREREQARKELMARELNSRLAQAKAQLEGARRVMELAPKQVVALQTVLEQAQARYKAGLGTLLEVSDAQRQLTQAEIDAALARLGVWRAELAVAYAAGDLEPFLAKVP